MKLGLVCAAAVLFGATVVSDGGARQGGSSIFFWSDSPWASIWVMRPDGSHRRPLYRTSQNAKRPTLSPDGRWIAFDGASPGKRPVIEFDVQIVRVDGGGRRTLAGSPATELDARWSPDGTHMSYSRRPAWADWRRDWIWIMRSDGTDKRRLVRGQFARWSPDGSRLALDAPTAGSEGDLFIVDADGTGLRRLAATPALEQPAGWSPDGTKILFTRYDKAGGSDVYVVKTDGTGVRRLTRTAARDDAAAWSPDGSKILFTSERTGRPQIFVMNADGSHQRNVSRNRLNDEATSWR